MSTPRPVTVGRIGKAHGLDGTFHVTRPNTQLIKLTPTLTAHGVAYEIQRVGGKDSSPTVKLKGIDTRNDVELMRGTDLYADRNLLPPLEDGEFWPEDLVGTEVKSTGGATIGSISEVLLLPSCDVLEVERDGQQKLLVPLIKDAVPEFDPQQKIVVVDLAFLGEE